MRIKRLTILFLIFIFSGIFILFCKESAVSADANVKWLSFNDGLKSAKQRKKPIIVDFYADWCYWCKKMDKDIFHDPKIVEKLSKDFVTVRVSTDKKGQIYYKNKHFNPQELSDYFGIKGLPTIVFLDYTGKPITKLPGYIASHIFIPVLDYIKEGCYLQKINFDDYVNKRASCKKKK